MDPRLEGRGWRTAAKQPVKNVELWQRLDALVAQGGHQIDWRWVKGAIRAIRAMSGPMRWPIGAWSRRWVAGEPACF